MATGTPTFKQPRVKIPKIAGLALAAEVIDKRIPVPEFIVGLDVSVEHTGWSIFNTATGEFRSGVLEPNPNKSKKIVQLAGMKRIQWIRDHIKSLVLYGPPPAEGQASNADLISCLVIIEGYAFGAKGSAGISLGELGGVLRMGFYDEGIDYIEIPPTQLKKFVTGSGGADKAIMLKEVLKRWGADFNDDNEADAYSLMQLGRALTDTYPSDLLAHQKIVVSDVMKTWLNTHPQEKAVEKAAA